MYLDQRLVLSSYNKHNKITFIREGHVCSDSLLLQLEVESKTSLLCDKMLLSPLFSMVYGLIDYVLCNE